MGLELVELVIELEEEFGISIPDRLATQMTTVGLTADMIVSLLNQKPQATAGVCQSSRSFYRLRQELVNRFGVSPDEVQLDTPIGVLVPREGERQWVDISDAAGLRRERRVLFKRRFPPANTRLRTLIESRCKLIWCRVDGSIDPAGVYQRVRQIVSEQLKISMQRINRETRYLQDLHMG